MIKGHLGQTRQNQCSSQEKPKKLSQQEVVQPHGERISDTVSWFPEKVTMPLASSNDLILAALLYMTSPPPYDIRPLVRR
jgi:hypothetical protein